MGAGRWARGHGEEEHLLASNHFGQRCEGQLGTRRTRLCSLVKGAVRMGYISFAKILPFVSLLLATRRVETERQTAPVEELPMRNKTVGKQLGNGNSAFNRSSIYFCGSSGAIVGINFFPPTIRTKVTLLRSR